jgi:hypothetical protein
MLTSLVATIALAWIQPQQNPKPLILTQEVRIGKADGPPEYAFGQLGYMAVTSKGSFFLFDYSDTQIRRYDSSGRFVGLVGRSGAGPGEYRRVSGMAVLGDSVLVVCDDGNRRITVLDTTGAYVRSFPIQRIAFGPKLFFVDQAGMVYIRAPVLHDRPSRAVQYLKMGLDGKIRDSIPIPLEVNAGSAFVLLTSDGGRASFPKEDVFTLLPTGDLVTANTGTYRFDVRTARFGSHTIERAIPPIPITGAERAEWEARASYSAARSSPPSPAIEIPRVKPAFRDISADPSGRIWVNLYTKAEKRNIPPRPAGDTRPLLTMREVNVYDLFDLRGRYLGQVTLPPQSQLMAVSGDRIWVKTEAEGGEFILTRYRIGGLPPS